jgi:hypothetical protein
MTQTFKVGDQVSQHPADLKPRGVKPPLGLLPYSVWPMFAPQIVVAAMCACDYYPDRDYKTKDPRPFLRTLIGKIDADPEAVARAFGFGAAKYAAWNWQSFTWDRAATTEYFGALCRHLQAREDGEECAPDSGVEHDAHATAGALIWLWHEEKIRGAVAEPAPEPAPEPIKVGDRVRITKSNGSWAPTAGRTGTVACRDPGCSAGLVYQVTLDTPWAENDYAWAAEVERLS